MFTHPIGVGQLCHQGFVQPPGVAVVDVLNGGVVAELGPPQPGLEPSPAPFGHFAVDHQAEPLLGRQCLDLGHRELLLVRPRHARQAQLVEFVEGWVCQHHDLLVDRGSTQRPGYWDARWVRGWFRFPLAVPGDPGRS